MVLVRLEKVQLASPSQEVRLVSLVLCSLGDIVQGGAYLIL